MMNSGAIPADSGHSGAIPADSGAIPAELPDSGRNLWSTVKYCRRPAFSPPLVEGCGQATCHITAQIPRRFACCQRRPPSTMSPLKRPVYAMSQPLMTATCHLTTQNQCVCHVTDDADPQPPPHHPKGVCMPCHGRQRPVEEAQGRDKQEGVGGGRGGAEGTNGVGRDERAG